MLFDTGSHLVSIAGRVLEINTLSESLVKELPDDIREYIQISFPDDVTHIESALGSIESSRVARCVLHLSDGNLDKLERMHEASQQDWRDVIWWAEYDHPQNPEVRIHDFNQPFGESKL